MDLRRLYSALFFIPLLYATITYSPSWLFAVLLSITALFALWEFLGLYYGVTRASLEKIFTSVLAGFFLLILAQGVIQSVIPWLLGIIGLVLLGFLLNPGKMRIVLPSWVGYLLGILYVPLLLGHFILLRQLNHGVEFVFFALIVTWLSDTGGFVVGRSLGTHPLAPTLSPKKTIEGLVGGILFSVFGAVICHYWFFPFFSMIQCAMLGLAMALFGALGDLAESGIKRSVNVKDSGTIIPGHGGVLDRVDSLLFSGPAFYYLLRVSGT